MKASVSLLPLALLAFTVGCSETTPPASSSTAPAKTETPAVPTSPPSGLSAIPGSITKTKDVIGSVNARAAEANTVTAPDTTVAKVTAVAKEALPLLLEQLKTQAAASKSANQPKIADLLGTKVTSLTSSFAPAQQQGLGSGIEGLLGGLIKGDSGSALS